MAIDTSKIVFSKVDKELFNTVAKKTAEAIADNIKKNKPTQIRKFYDEILMWNQRVQMNKDQFSQYLPFILMINAKVAYAKGRDLVDDEYSKLMDWCLKQIDSPATMENCKLFMEAVMGFFKACESNIDRRR